jgi:hypothetical protein
MDGIPLPVFPNDVGARVATALRAAAIVATRRNTRAASVEWVTRKGRAR